MTNEQREAIKICEHYKNILYACNYEKGPERTGQAIETALSLIKEQQEKMENKDKQIDLMAFNLADYVMYYDYDKCRNPEMIKNKAKEIKQYFERKVEDVES